MQSIALDWLEWFLIHSIDTLDSFQLEHVQIGLSSLAYGMLHLDDFFFFFFFFFFSIQKKVLGLYWKKLTGKQQTPSHLLH